MELRPIQLSDIDMVYGWWKRAGLIMPPVDTWPSTTFIGAIDNVPMYAISLHLTNSPLAWIENFIANPEIPDTTRKKLVKYGLDQLTAMAKSHGAKYFWAYASHPKLEEYYKELGFTVMQTSLTSMARKI